MKKIMILLSLVMCCCTSRAQSSYEFMGIPIEGNIYEFAKKLEAKGFKKTPIYYTKGDREVGYILDYCFTGTFFGEPNAEIHLSTYSQENKNICNVNVLWKRLDYTLYAGIRQGLMEKYSTDNGYLHDTDRDCELLSHKDIQNTLNSGGYFQFGICQPNINIYYVRVMITINKTHVIYTNPKSILEYTTSKRVQGKSDL